MMNLFPRRKVEIRLVKDEKPDIQTPAKTETVAVDADVIVEGVKSIIQTYFVWKIADRLASKILS